MKRLYTFGCSFTQYFWPTWADILGREFDHYENWGRMAGGNQYIFNSITECLVKNQLTKDDTIIVMWTGVTREDRYVKEKGGWVNIGNIFSQKVFSPEFVKEWGDIPGYYIRDLATIHATKRMLDTYGVPYIFASMIPINSADQYVFDDISNELKEYFTVYNESLSRIRPSVFEVIFNYDWSSRPWMFNSSDDAETHYKNVAGADWPSFKDFYNMFVSKKYKIKEGIAKEIFDPQWNWGYHIAHSKRHDVHPTPAEHLEYIEKIMPEFTISQDTRNWVTDIEGKVRARQDFSDLWIESKNFPLRW